MTFAAVGSGVAPPLPPQLAEGGVLFSMLKNCFDFEEKVSFLVRMFNSLVASAVAPIVTPPQPKLKKLGAIAWHF
jgi:hypothetical protein